MTEAAGGSAAEQGLAAMRRRGVQAAGGQRNKWAAHYHFGSRAGLVEAVIASRRGPINEARLAMLAELDAGIEPPSLRDLVAVLVEPLDRKSTRLNSSH